MEQQSNTSQVFQSDSSYYNFREALTYCSRDRFVPWDSLILPRKPWVCLSVIRSTHIPLTKLICSTIKITKNGIHIQKELKKWFLKFIFFLWKGLVVLFVFNEEIAFKGTLMQI